MRPPTPDKPDRLADAREALASGQARRAIELARPIGSDASRALMTLAYCRLHNGHAARALARQLSPGSLGRVRGRCARAGVSLD